MLRCLVVLVTVLVLPASVLAGCTSHCPNPDTKTIGCNGVTYCCEGSPCGEEELFCRDGIVSCVCNTCQPGFHSDDDTGYAAEWVGDWDLASTCPSSCCCYTQLHMFERGPSTVAVNQSHPVGTSCPDDLPKFQTIWTMDTSVPGVSEIPHSWLPEYAKPHTLVLNGDLIKVNLTHESSACYSNITFQRRHRNHPSNGLDTGHAAAWAGYWTLKDGCPAHATCCCPTLLTVSELGTSVANFTFLNSRGSTCDKSTEWSTGLVKSGIVEPLTATELTNVGPFTMTRHGDTLTAKAQGCLGTLTFTRVDTEGCFPGDAIVTRSDGTLEYLKHLQAGDSIASVNSAGDTVFDTVFRVTHADPEAVGTMVRLTTTDGAVLRLTRNHMLHVGTCCSLSTLAPASTVVAGDTVFMLSTDASPSTTVTPVEVAEVRLVVDVASPGLYNVHTLSGNLIVDGFAASHFTTATTWGPSSRWLAPAWYNLLHATGTA